jgi:putative Ca2+/H+ antiporter (TMEM165/GDT1 family)
MAMKYNRVLIFLGAAGALLVMTILSVGIGFALPNLIPKQYTHYAAAALFFYFGVKLLMESREAPAESGEHSELAEAEEELAALKLGGGNGSGEGGKFRGGKEVDEEGGGEEDIENTTSSSTPTGGSMQRNGSGSGGGNGSGALLDLGAGAAESSRETDPSAKFSVTKRGGEVGFMASLQRDWPVLTQAFMITFLAEWGDRSQIATIAMAAAQHPVGGECVCGGGGGAAHPLCSITFSSQASTHAPFHTLTLNFPTSLITPPPSSFPGSCLGLRGWPCHVHRVGSDWWEAAGIPNQ